jgi:hypothetical protein
VLIPALFLVYSCLISTLFFDFGFMQYILRISASFLPFFGFWFSAAYSAYSCLIPALFPPYFLILVFCGIFCLFLPYSWLIPALFLVYFWGVWFSAAYSTCSCLIPGAALFPVYSGIIPTLFLHFIFVFCSIFCLFLPYSWRIPAVFLPYFWILVFCSILCLFLVSCCLIRSLYYSCLIPALFLDVCFLHPYVAYSWFFGAYFLGAYLCEIYLLHFGSKQQTENSYIFVVSHFFDRLEPCSEISPVCHPWG